ncbi:hypothetical protein Hamer_G031942 [Homarus americanus]|uniref:Uncharacterized protein n=1 Tax=Homarus americanus TaxID=6706 RepID=A0A8J5K382_HOMAM|nr:hypothetical protein Hamer_G031942 [Homarus americanus]
MEMSSSVGISQLVEYCIGQLPFTQSKRNYKTEKVRFYTHHCRQRYTRLLHTLHCARQGHQRVMIRTVDGNVVLLTMRIFQYLPLDDLQITFAKNKLLCDKKANAIAVFHAFTSCDTVSAFIGMQSLAWLVNQRLFRSGRCLKLKDLLFFSAAEQVSVCKPSQKTMFTKGNLLEHIPHWLSFQKSKISERPCLGRTLVAQQNVGRGTRNKFVKSPGIPYGSVFMGFKIL